MFVSFLFHCHYDMDDVELCAVTRVGIGDGVYSGKG